MRSLEGKNVVITGAGRSTGRALAAALADQGAKLHLSARALSAAENTCQFIQDVTGQTATPYCCDIADPEVIRSFAGNVGKNTGSIDILINNAATWLSGSFLLTTDDELISAVNSTVTGTILVTKQFLPLLQKSENPDVLSLISQSGLKLQGSAAQNEAYHAAKSAQTAFMNRLRQTQPRCRVMSVFPPDFESDIEYKSPEWFEPAAPAGGKTMTVRHVAEAILFALQQDRVCTIESLVLANSAIR